jgi:exonuclease III
VKSFYPPGRERYPVLLQNLRSEHGLADILILQEVSDDFLCHILRDEDIRHRYTFTSRAPPDQDDVGPLPSLRDIVVLSRWSFSWECRHKSAIFLTFEAIGNQNGTGFLPLVVAGVHLSPGFTNGSITSIATRQSEFQAIFDHLSANYKENPWIVAGDFNIMTSTFTIDEALKTNSVSAKTVMAISSVESLLAEGGLSDSWRVARTSDCTSSSVRELFPFLKKSC